MQKNKLIYLELPATDVSAMKTFYGDLFGWTFQDYGLTYAAFSNSGVEGGFNGDSDQRTSAPLAVIETDDIATMEASIRKAGGTITVSTFSFPGGRRFHFRDPHGNELAVMQAEDRG